MPADAGRAAAAVLRPGAARERPCAVLASWRRPETALAGRRGRGAGRRGALPAGAGSDEPRERRSPSTTPRARTQVGEVVRGVGKVSLDVRNFLLKINGKYDLTDKAGAQLKDQLNKLKAGSSGETIAKVEDALSKATSKFNELDKEYDLVEKGKQALGYAGDLSAKAIDKGRFGSTPSAHGPGGRQGDRGQQRGGREGDEETGVGAYRGASFEQEAPEIITVFICRDRTVARCSTILPARSKRARSSRLAPSVCFAPS